VKRHPRVELVREPLGAIADRLPAVFWLYIDCDGRWSVRREGALKEEKFGSHEAALEFLELEAARCSSYRLFLQCSDGRISEESNGRRTGGTADSSSSRNERETGV
jgi:hypothetical protein